MVAKPYFSPVDLKINFPEMEKKLLDYWYKKGIVKKYLSKNRNSKKRFSFLDGPITANNPMGVHHAWGRTYKDLWQRYKNMRGFKERFQNGFDCQGLWVEVEVEKELGLKSKKDIENLVPGNKEKSIAKFVELCKARVKKYSKIQTEQSKRLGYFMDWENSYYTLSDENNYMIWYFLKKCWEKGLIYKGTDSVPWCPRCGTAISQHEILTEDYKELTHETVFFKVPVKEKDFSLLVWTTTPWTIPANVALAVNSDFIYREWINKRTGEKIVFIREDQVPKEEGYDLFVKNILEESQWRAGKSFQGKELVGLTYKGPFDDLPRVVDAMNSAPQTFHKVVEASDLVVATKGTGILHVAPGAGEEDFKLGKEKNLAVIEVINEEANYYSGMNEFSGRNAKNEPNIIIDYLRKKDGGKFFFKISSITHRYPACWRCKTELVWRVVDEWYIAIDPVRDDMKAVARRINWIPKFGLKRELDWLDNMHDWLISKKRYWGLALPIWECASCGNFELIGGKQELKEKSIRGWKKFEGHSPHRPWIDAVEIACSKCLGVCKRVPDVGNPWLDAGIVSFSTICKDNKGAPLYIIDKSQWAEWFPADFITESFPGQFKNWFYSLIAMSTVLEKREPFKTVLGFATLLAEDGRPMHKSWGNAIEFNEAAEKIGVDVMRWMYLRQNPSENLLFGYKLADEVRRKFYLKIWNIYNFFVTYANLEDWKPTSKNNQDKLIRIEKVLDSWILSRFSEVKKEVTNLLDSYNAYGACMILEAFVDDFSNWYIRRSRKREDKNNLFGILYYLLVNLSRVLAPFTPFISDAIYRNLTKEDSVHLSDWPVEDLKVDEALITRMTRLRKIVEIIHSQRKRKNIPVRQPLLGVEVVASFPKPESELVELLKDEVNVHNLKWSIGKTLKVKLNTKITPRLKEEARVRELIRKIQLERKKIGIGLTDKIYVFSPWVPADPLFIKKILRSTLAKSIKKGTFKITRASS